MFSLPASRVNAQTVASPTVIKSANNVVVSYTEGSCQGQSVLFLRIENNNTLPKTITYSLFGGPQKTITVSGSTTAEGGCAPSQENLNETIPAASTISDLAPAINIQ
jgi:hypothetical protein